MVSIDQPTYGYNKLIFCITPSNLDEDNVLFQFLNKFMNKECSIPAFEKGNDGILQGFHKALEKIQAEIHTKIQKSTYQTNKQFVSKFWSRHIMAS